MLQLGIVIAEGFFKDELLLRAYRLTFLMMISIVPLLAIAVSLVDMFGGGEEVVADLLDSFAAVTPEASAFILEQVGQFNFAALGGVSGGIVLVTTVLQIGGIEQALNAIWGVKEQRPWVRRVPDYMAIVIVPTVLMGIAIPLRTTVENQYLVKEVLQVPGMEALYDTGLQHAPLFLSILAFSFLYWFLPNTKVRGSAAFLGGTVAAVLFSLAQLAFVATVVGSARYNAAFGALAGAALFMLWVYWSWCVVLFGAEVAYAFQTLALYRREVRGTPPGPAGREAIGLAIAVQCARAFREQGEPWSADTLSDSLEVPLRTVREILDELAEAGILAPCGGEQAGAFQIGRPLEQVRVSDVLTALRGPRNVELGVPEVARQVAETLDPVEQAARQQAESRNLRDLVLDLPASPPAVVEALGQRP